MDPDWIRIRIGVHPKMLDPDPDPEKMNTDPQPNYSHILRLRPTPYITIGPPGTLKSSLHVPVPILQASIVIFLKSQNRIYLVLEESTVPVTRKKLK